MWLREKKKLRSLIRFHNANKIDNYKREEKKKGKKIQKNLQNKSKHENNKCFSWVIGVKSSFPLWESQSTLPP